MTSRKTSGESAAAPGRRGFTLLELLIVVAAVTILSGMAVPVFLEAKVRANVSRAKADMRMVAMAMETFFVDHGEYPVPDDENGEPIPADVFDRDPFDTRIPTSLTDPVAYIDYRLDDPFVATGAPEDRTFLLYTKYYFDSALGEGSYKTYMEELVGPASVLNVEYVVVSRGPDLDHEEPVGHTWPTSDANGDASGTTLYDPTNGTMSNGDVVYMGAGIGYKQQ